MDARGRITANKLLFVGYFKVFFGTREQKGGHNDAYAYPFVECPRFYPDIIASSERDWGVVVEAWKDFVVEIVCN